MYKLVILTKYNAATIHNMYVIWGGTGRRHARYIIEKVDKGRISYIIAKGLIIIQQNTK